MSQLSQVTNVSLGTPGARMPLGVCADCVIRRDCPLPHGSCLALHLIKSHLFHNAVSRPPTTRPSAVCSGVLQAPRALRLFFSVPPVCVTVCLPLLWICTLMERCSLCPLHSPKISSLPCIHQIPYRLCTGDGRSFPFCLIDFLSIMFA